MKDKGLEKEKPQDEIKRLKKRIKDLEEIMHQQQDYAQALHESESRYKMVFESANDGIIIHDTQGRILDVNPTMYKRLGYSKKEMLKMSLRDLVSPEYAERINQRVAKLKEEGVAIFESADRRKDGTFMPVEVSARYTNYQGKRVIQSIVRDIHDRKLAEDLISKTLNHKEMLLDEIKRRVRHNHQTYKKILEHIFVHTEHAYREAAFKAAQSRIESIAFIQDKIYRQNSFSRIDFSKTIRSLVRNLYSQHNTGTGLIQIKQEIQNAPLYVSKSVPAALIAYELLSNSLKHAFPAERKGQITLKYGQNKRCQYMLVIKDDGIGFPDDIDFRRTKTLGMRLVIAQVNQLSGKIKLKRNKGTEFIITFA